jgi:uncharacterized protein with GYD domain
MEETMPRFLLELAYTPEAWASQLEHPTNRIDVLKPVLDTVGARFESAYFAFGSYDIVAVIDAPDNISAAALSLAFSAGGSVRDISTTPLLTVEEGLEAMRKGTRALTAYKPLTRQLATAGKN